MGYKFKSFKEFVTEQSYDEQDPAPKASYRAQDYQCKDDLRHIVVNIDEILAKIEDGEQLEDSQLKLIQDAKEIIFKLKRQIDGKEKVEKEKEEKEQEEREFDNGLQ